MRKRDLINIFHERNDRIKQRNFQVPKKLAKYSIKRVDLYDFLEERIDSYENGDGHTSKSTVGKQVCNYILENIE